MISTGMPSPAKGRARAAGNHLPGRDGSGITTGTSADNQNCPAPEGAVEIINVSKEDEKEDDAIIKSRLIACSWGYGDSNWVTLALYPSHVAT